MNRLLIRISFGLLAAALLTHPAQAGVLSAIVKAAGKVDMPTSGLKNFPDGSLQQLKLIMPDGTPPVLINAKLNADSQWVLKNPQGEVVTDVGQLNNAALVINKAHLPRNLRLLDTLPANKHVLIHANGAIFQLQRKPIFILRSGGAGIKVKDYAQLQTAIAHFQRPWANGPVRILGLKDQAANSLSLRRGVGRKTLINTPQQLRGQTVAIAGRIEGDQIKTAAGNFSIRELRNNAEQYDISLLIIDAEKPINPKALLKQLDTNMVDGVPQNTGQFLAQLHDPKAAAFYKISPTGKHQVLINRIERAPAKASPQLDVGELVLARSALAASQIALLRPSEERARELENRLIAWLPAWIPFYLIVSAVLGLIAIKTTLDFADRLWPWQTSEATLARKFEIGVWLILLVLLFIPLLGAPIALYRLSRIIISAVGWLFNLLIGLSILLLMPFVKLWKYLRASEPA